MPSLFAEGEEADMDSVNKTLYIPLYGKALVSRKGLILRDPKAEEIWEKEGFSLKGKAASKWLAYNMGMRSRVFDRWLEEILPQMPGAAVLHIGCGMDSRVCRVAHEGHRWFDLDFPEVIAQRRKHYAPNADYEMIASDAREISYLDRIPGEAAIVIMEGVSMYLTGEERLALLTALRSRFPRLLLLMDCYTVFGAKASKYKNPVNEVGVTTLYGIDDPKELEASGLYFRKEHSMTPEDLIGQLQGFEQRFFRKLFAGSFAKKIYRLYEFSSQRG